MHELRDGRCLMASYDDISKFFAKNDIIGKIIEDIIPFCHDYMIQNIVEVNDFMNKRTQSSISTDGRICLLFTDNTNLEIEFSGDGPVVLGYNTAKLSEYPKYNGECYRLSTMFKFCLGYTIVGVHFERTDKKMLFPSYYGIDMSEEDDGVREIRFALNGGTTLMASGVSDEFRLEHFMDFGGPVEVEYAELITDLSKEAFQEYFGEWIQEYENKVYEEDSWERFSVEDVFYDDIDGLEYGKFGFKNSRGEVVIEPQFWCCDEFQHGLAAVAIKGPLFKASNGKMYNQELWGYIDKTGRGVIPFRFGRANGFNKYGVAVAQDEWDEDADCYLIDTYGREIPGTRFRYIDAYYDYEDRFLEFSNVDTGADNNIGLYDTKERKIIIMPNKGSVLAWSEDFIEISETGSYGCSDFYKYYINAKGEILYPGLKDKGFNGVDKPNANGHVIVYKKHFYQAEESVTSWNPIFGKKYRSHQYYGVVDLGGNVLIPLRYKGIRDNEDGTFLCENEDGTELITLK